MAEEITRTQSIQTRIAALNLGHVGRAPVTTPPANADEDALERPRLDRRSYTTNVPSTLGASPFSKNSIGNEPLNSRQNGVLPPPTITSAGQLVSKPAKPPAPPRLPPRTSSSQQTPSLPPRRPSAPLSKRKSSESIASTMSNNSINSQLSNGTISSRTAPVNTGRTMAPAYNSTTLPPLPLKRQNQGAEKQRMPLKGTRSTPDVVTVEAVSASKPPSLPQRAPAPKETLRPERQLPPEPARPTPAKPAFARGIDNSREHEIGTSINQNASNPPHTSANGVPTPIPLASRPSLSSILATKPKPQSIAPAALCLLCRDFSGPDAHAAKFPRESVPSLDWLATQLVAPFSSLTDRARAIFTWLHHNISYDVVSFFNNTCKPSTPATTLSTGLAVCEGYAGLFTAIATKAGLESVVVKGHGKGFGFAGFPPGTLIPPESSNHAWNAVRIDRGEWKLIDCCWGAGYISGKGQPYTKSFNPHFFTMPNDDFGLRHFPTNRSHLFRPDGGRVSWEDYLLGDRGGEPVRIFSVVAATEGIAETSLLPRHLRISLAAIGTSPAAAPIRFQFERICPHWDPVRHGPGKPYVFILAVHGPDGRADDYIPLETDGARWWVDVHPGLLGVRGQTVTLYTVETVGARSARGLGIEAYRAAKGREGMSFGGVAAWELD